MKRLMRLSVLTCVLVLAARAPATAGGGSSNIGIIGAFDHATVTYRVANGTGRLGYLAHAAFRAWENAAHAYAASHPSAAHLAGLEIAPAPAGSPADVDVVLGPTGIVYYGVDFPTATPHLLNNPTLPHVVDGGRLVHSTVELPLVYVGSCGFPATGTCAGIPGGIAVGPVRTLSERDFYAIALHEYGHALGLAHADAGLMYPTYFSDANGAKAGDFCFSNVELEGLSTAYRWLAQGVFAPPPPEVDVVAGAGACVPLQAGAPSTLVPWLGDPGLGPWSRSGGTLSGG